MKDASLEQRPLLRIMLSQEQRYVKRVEKTTSPETFGKRLPREVRVPQLSAKISVVEQASCFRAVRSFHGGGLQGPNVRETLIKHW